MISPDTRSASIAADSFTTPSALQLTREAIARWRGANSVAAQPRDVRRVSPQARYLEQARCDLASWIAQGGFGQTELAGYEPRTMHTAPRQVGTFVSAI